MSHNNANYGPATPGYYGQLAMQQQQQHHPHPHQAQQQAPQQYFGDGSYNCDPQGAYHSVGAEGGGPGSPYAAHYGGGPGDHYNYNNPHPLPQHHHPHPMRQQMPHPAFLQQQYGPGGPSAMMRQPPLLPPRPPGLAGKANCHTVAAPEGGGFGFALDRPHFNNGYDDNVGCAGAPPQFGAYPMAAAAAAGGGGDRVGQRDATREEYTYKKEEEPGDPPVHEADDTPHKRLKMSPSDAGGGLYDDRKKCLAPDGVAGSKGVNAKTSNDGDDFENPDRSHLALEVKEESANKAETESCSINNSAERKSGEQANRQHGGHNNGSLMDIPELPEIPELKFNEAGEGQRAKEEQQQQPGEGGGEADPFRKHGLGPVGSGDLSPLPPASSPSSSLPSGIGRQHEGMSQPMTAGESNTQQCCSVGHSNRQEHRNGRVTKQASGRGRPCVARGGRSSGLG